MEKFPLISIVVITYNSSKTIVETLESIKRQSYPNLEIIISDDCSNDDTVIHSENWFKKNTIKGDVISSKKNLGISANVNKGIMATNGNLLKIIAGDDILKEKAIETYYKYYLKDKNVIWQSKVLCFGDDKKKVAAKQNALCNFCFFESSNEEQLKMLSISNRIISPGLGLLPKFLFKKYGYYDERFPMLDDYPFNLKMSKNGICFKLIDEELVLYRINENSVTGAASKRYYQSMRNFFFAERFWIMYKNGNYADLTKQTFKYLLTLFDLTIVTKDGKLSIIRL